MKIIADTTVILRLAIPDDDPWQERVAAEALRNAEAIAITLPTLCEFVWVLARGYRKRPEQIGDAIRRLVNVQRVRTDRAALEAGLSTLDAGGNFADGVIAFEGTKLGGEVFVTFDREAAALLHDAGNEVRLLAPAGDRQ